MGFVHLHNHSEYSLLDGLSRCSEIAERCNELGFDAYALTDHGVMYGVIEFYKTMREHGIKPIIGVEAYLAPRSLTDKEHGVDNGAAHLTLLAKNEQGYQNLIDLTTIAHVEGFYYNPRIDFEVLSEHHEGLLCTTGCMTGPLAKPYLDGEEDEAVDNLHTLLDIFGEDRLWAEVQNHQIDEERRYREWLIDKAEEQGLRLLATNDTHYVHADDSHSHEIAVCMNTGSTIHDEDRMTYEPEEFYIRSEEEMRELFSEHPEACDNTVDLAEEVELELELGNPKFPIFHVPEEEEDIGRDDHEEFLRRETYRGAVDRYLVDGELEWLGEEELGEGGTEPVDVSELPPEVQSVDRVGELPQGVADRIEEELRVINNKGYASYFLIVDDFIEAAREMDVPVGPGRGSAGGSLTAYCLEITDICPLRWGLLFERFLNPERESLPDIDIDFCYETRDRVFDYVVEEYGEEKVAQIITFNRLKARAAIKAVGRVLDLPFQYVNKVTKLIRGLGVTIEEAIEQNPELKRRYQNEDRVKKLLDESMALEGLASHSGVHAAGVVIGDKELTEYVPLEPQEDSELRVTQYEMHSVEDVGLVKMDFLGLRNLTTIQETVDLVEEHEGEEINIRQLPLDDEETYELFQRGDTWGIFQFERRAIRSIMQESKPESLEDLTALNALNRPGPLENQMDRTYIENRRNPEQITYPIPELEPILKPTNGVLLYQEQVMQMARDLAGYSLGEADLLRRAMGKKKEKLMRRQQEEFIERAVERGLDQRDAETVAEMIGKFARYGFNKSHSAAYSLISYRTAYLKVHYPVYYMTALLNSFIGKTDKLKECLAECREMDIEIRGPSVNNPSYKFSPEAGAIRYGLAGIKGVGTSVVEAVRDAHGGEPFADIDDFLRRTDRSAVNKGAMEALIKAGAFDELGEDRAFLLENLARISDPDLNLDQRSMFGDSKGGFSGGTSDAYTDNELAWEEREVLGLFLSQHPYSDLEIFQDERMFTPTKIKRQAEDDPHRFEEHDASRVAGVLVDVERRYSKKTNNVFVMARLEDMDNALPIMVFSNALEEVEGLLEDDNQVVIDGRIELEVSADGTLAPLEEGRVIVDDMRLYDPGTEETGADDSDPQTAGSKPSVDEATTAGEPGPEADRSEPEKQPAMAGAAAGGGPADQTGTAQTGGAASDAAPGGDAVADRGNESGEPDAEEAVPDMPEIVASSEDDPEGGPSGETQPSLDDMPSLTEESGDTESPGSAGDSGEPASSGSGSEPTETTGESGPESSTGSADPGGEPLVVELDPGDFDRQRLTLLLARMKEGSGERPLELHISDGETTERVRLSASYDPDSVRGTADEFDLSVTG